MEVTRRPALGVARRDDFDAPPSGKQNPIFALSTLVPAIDDEDATSRSVYSGPRLWADLSRSLSPSPGSDAGVLPTLAPSTAYCVRLSTKTSPVQPESVVDGVVITAPPAPSIETVAGREAEVPSGAVAGEGVGVVALKAVWRTDLNTSFLPAGVEPPLWSIALEMAQACEAGPAAGGVGGTATKIAQPAPSERRTPQAAHSRATAMSSVVADPTAPVASPNAARTANVAPEVPVRKDAGGGQCWTLSSSSWGKPSNRAEGFRVVWKGAAGAEGGLVEVTVPPLAPGMRFAFRVRLECCFGVAVSAATVYQTAVVAPVSPQVQRRRNRMYYLVMVGAGRQRHV